MKNKQQKRQLRHARVKKSLKTSARTPRLVVFRSNKHIYAQIIDDANSKTIVAEADLGKKNSKAGNKLEKAGQIGMSLAEKAKKAKINRVVFDRAGYKFHGRVKAVAEGARKGGLSF